MITEMELLEGLACFWRLNKRLMELDVADKLLMAW